MLKKFPTILFLTLMLTACGQQARQEETVQKPTWQEQYDLGVRYLSEGNYQEAIIAFTTAIEIDPKQAPAYVGRGGSYIGSGTTMENLNLAQTDYEKAIELDETLVDAYLKLAEIYADKNDYDKVLKLLQCGLVKTSSDLIEAQYIKVLSEADRFVADPTFVPFSKLDPALQDLIETAMDEISEDPEKTAKLIIDNYNDLMEKGAAPVPLRTMKANYKIQMSYVNLNMEDGRGAQFEMRPLDGIAYYCSGGYTADKLHINHGWGTCENWNWNGTFEMTITDSSGGTHIHSGNCVDGLLDGAIYKPDSQKSTLTGDYTPYYEYYDHGKMTGKISYEDGHEEYRNHGYSEEDVFFYASRTDVGWYEYWILW